MSKKPYIHKNKLPKSLQKKQRPIKRIMAKFKKSPKQTRESLPQRIPGKRRKWSIPSLVSIGSLLLIILVIPSVIVVPFMNEDSKHSVVEADPAAKIEHETPVSVSVMRTEQDNLIEQVPLETYVARVVASEMPTEFDIEALKAQGLAARTYIVDHMLHQGEDAEVTDQVGDQVYKNEEELREQWGEEYHEKMTKITEAIAATEGEILTHNGAPITAAYFSTGNGFTENSEDYWDQELDYLRSVESPWDEESPKFLDQRVLSIHEVENALGINIPDHTHVNIELSKTDSERINQMEIAGEQFTGREVREKLSLQSSDFTIEQNNGHLIFKTKGFGHGIGMSQYGANGMAEEGKTYEEIVDHYYQNVEIRHMDDIRSMIVANE